MEYNTLPSSQTLTATQQALEKNGITVSVAASADEAKRMVLDRIPAGSEVMTMTSITLEQTGIAEALQSDTYRSVRKQLMATDSLLEGRQKQQLGAAPEYVVGSVHAVTETGSVLIASNTGSQLPAYAYGSDHVIWVVGAQKIVPSVEVGLQRIEQYIVPQETVRARAAYGLPDSFHTFVSKLLIVNREVNAGRIHVILVNEVLGF